MIILISGKMGSGKSTLTENLLTTLRELSYLAMSIKFADPLYEMHSRVLSVLVEYGVPTPKKDGLLLQQLGTEWGRKAYGENIWVDLAKKKVESFMDGDKPNRRVAIIDDCRFKNELFGFPEALKVRLVCDRDARKSRTDAWRENEMHQSEVDLDDVDPSHFDLVIDTGLNTKEQVLETVLAAVAAKKVPNEFA